MLIPLLVALLGIALGAGGIGLLRRFGSTGTEQLTTAADHRAAAKPLSSAALKARIDPSVVDITATLTYDDETASGTGFVVDSGRGLILTNNHVIRDATSVVVTVPATGQTFPASIVGADVTADIAVLSVSSSIGLPNAPLGDSTTADTGTPVVSFGNQAGEGGSPTVAAGVITGTGRTIQADDGAAGFSETLRDMLATSAQIEPGDSGGPLASTTGTIIGVDTAAGTDGSTIGYAIPINTAVGAERQIAAHHAGNGVTIGVDGFLGVLVGPAGSNGSPAAQQRQALGSGTGSAASSASTHCVPTQADAEVPARIAPAPAGTLVAGVLCGTGASSAGIVPGDVVTAVDGRQVDSPSALTSLVSSAAPGSVMQVTWVTMSGATRSAGVRLGPAPAV
jgi:S1-C subfamily serine protease